MVAMFDSASTSIKGIIYCKANRVHIHCCCAYINAQCNATSKTDMLRVLVDNIGVLAIKYSFI
jgi:hypothetical protein